MDATKCPTDTDAAPAAPTTRVPATRIPGRNFRIDEIRVALTTLVIFHHTAITYGATGGWYFREPRTLTLTTVLLTIFCSVNQAYFMGFFFLLAGYFTPRSLAHKGESAFIRDRLMRLGIPLLVYGFLIGPATESLADIAEGRSFFDSLAARLGHHEYENGPLWFVQSLLIFTAVYLAFRHIRGAPRPGRVPDTPTAHPNWARYHTVLLAGLIAVGGAAFLIRLEYRVGYSFLGLQYAYFASYIFLFWLGCVAARDSLLEAVDQRFARPWIWVSLVSLPLLTLYAVASGVLHGVRFSTSGGMNLPSLAYAFWEPLVAWGLILWFLTTRSGKPLLPLGLGRRMAPLAYGAYIVHPPLLVGTALLLHGWNAPAALKFACVGAVACGASFSLAGALRALPGADRVL